MDMRECGSVSDPRRSNGAGWSIAAAVASLVLLSVVVPAGFAFFGAVRSAPFFGVEPSEAERAQSAEWLWAAFLVSAASLVAIISLAVVNRRRRGVAAFIVISLLAGGVAGVWLIVALGTQRASDTDAATVVQILAGASIGGGLGTQHG